MIWVNDIFKSKINGDEFRVLWISFEDDLAYVFNLANNKLPVSTYLTKLIEQLENGEIQKRIDDPYINTIPEEAITKNDKLFRDSVWNLVKDIVEDEPAIYDRVLRGRMLDERSKVHNVTKNTLYKYLRWYWQRGKTKNSLLPQIHKRGGKGKTRKLSDKKIGRPSQYTTTIGKNVDEATKQIFAKAVKKYYHTRREYSFKAAYELMIKEFYTEPIEQACGTIQNELLAPNEIPSLRQFQYWYSKTYNSKEKLVARKGQSQYDLQHRSVLGKSDTGISGPGAQYQIDATVGDIYLVSQFNRANIIGRPVIYFVIDTFSRMVTGMYIGLEGPSWTGSMMALANSASDKVLYCANYGVTISDEEWPCCHIPDSILADRGEMESKSVETLINALNVRVDNTPAFRADMKSVVERWFLTINIKTTVFLPGHVKPDMAQRGGRDYRLDAKLDIRQFTRIMIQCVLNHNNKHYLENFKRTELMVADGVKPIPKELWSWGIRNYSGQLRKVAADTIKLCLMPTDTALVTAKGIRFKGLHYLSERAALEHWFETARAKGSFKVAISYDPRDMKNIYIYDKNSAMLEKCYLTDWESKWIGKCLDELLQQQAEERALRNQNKRQDLQSSVDLHTEIEKVVTEAEEMAKQTVLPISKRERTSHIHNNRAAEKEQIRKEEAFSIGDIPKPHSTQIPEPPEKNIHPITALIKKMAEEDYDD
ncbi:MAG: Mu transposase C-terminal domain-containing protein [Oscillospiraceae bacterium]|nr:Mu transposase C-terminal domain-containing protein [Oscillospiraceae bacterium]